MNMNDAAWLLPLALLLTAALCLALIPLARRIGLVDHPGVRKVHEAVTPLTGGPALLLVLAVLGAWWLPGDRFLQALLAGGLLIFAVGLVDDFRELRGAAFSRSPPACSSSCGPTCASTTLAACSGTTCWNWAGWARRSQSSPRSA
jgi:MFS family permease